MIVLLVICSLNGVLSVNYETRYAFIWTCCATRGATRLGDLSTNCTFYDIISSYAPGRVAQSWSF